MDLETLPEWLTADFMRTCLREDKENCPPYISITNYRIKSTRIKPGDVLELKVKIYYQKHINSKNGDPPEDCIPVTARFYLPEGRIEQLNKALLYFYRTGHKFDNRGVLEMFKLINHNIIPRYFTSLNPHCVQEHGSQESDYVLYGTFKFLDLEHSQLYVKACAKLHALSIALNKANPKLVESLINLTEENICTKKYISWVIGLARCMANFIEDKPNYKEYFDVISQFVQSDKLLDIFLDLRRSGKCLKALIVNYSLFDGNMAFKYDSSGKVQDIKLLNLRCVQLGCPISEFVMFLWVKVHPDVRKTRLHFLYHLYCDSLNSSLKDLHCSERLPFGVFKQEVVRLSPLPLMVMGFLLPFSAKELAPGAIESIHTLFSDLGGYTVQNANNETVSERFRSLAESLVTGPTLEKYFLDLVDQMAGEGILDYVKSKMNLNYTS